MAASKREHEEEEEEDEDVESVVDASSSSSSDEDDDDRPAAAAAPAAPSHLDFSKLVLKPDHEHRPLWVTPNGTIYLERRSRFYAQAYEFLATVGEPVTRSEIMHEWKLTKNSLHSASSVELTPGGILDELEKLSKISLAVGLKQFVRKCADSYGKVKLVLVAGRLFVESTRGDLLRKLLTNQRISQARIKKTTLPVPPQQPQLQPQEEQPTTAATSTTSSFDAIFHDAANNQDDAPALDVDDEEEEEEEEDDAAPAPPRRRQFEIDAGCAEAVKNAALGMDLPLMEEFDYKQDASTPNIHATLNLSTEIRPYQAKCLAKMFSKSKAKSGLFVLPCGAGKTLSAIAAVCTMKKSTVIVCSSTIAVEQFKRQFHQFTDIPAAQVCRFTSKSKDAIPHQTSSGCVLLTTYSMLAINRLSATLDAALQRDWGLCILDEVHVAPAKLFRRILTRVKAHCKLGLTATMVREDALIQDLSFLIGPKLYEADWQSLTEHGYLARVLCQEVRCAFTGEFMAEYLRAGPQLANQLVALNPNKFLACEHLILLHEARGDKILVFCDNLLALEYYAATLHREMIHGQTPEKRRMELLGMFRFSSAVNTLFISKVGDMAIDLPEANVIVQVSSHFGSRRQEAQRLGRILRPKPTIAGTTASSSTVYNAHFYNLVVPDSQEQFYSNKRKRYLVDQGYAFRVVDDIAVQVQQQQQQPSKTSGALRTAQDQRRLLAKLLVGASSSAAVAAAPVATTTTTTTLEATLPKAKRVDRKSMSAASSAAGSTVYSEFDKRI